MHSTSDDHESIFGGYEGRLLGLIYLATLSGNGAQLLLPPLLPEIINDLAISSTAAGIGLSLMWIFTAAFHYPGGRFSDVLTRKSLLIPSIGIMLSGLLFISIFTNSIGFFIGIIILGIGAGIYTPVAFAQLSDLYIRRRGLALGINTASLNLGGFFGAIIAVVSLQFFTWRQAFIPLILTLLSVMILLHNYNDGSYSYSVINLDLISSIRRLIQTKKIRWALLATVCFGFVWQGILSFYPVFMQAEKGISVTLSGILFGGIFLIGTVVTPIAGRVGDTWSYLYVGVLSTILTGLGLLLIITFSTFKALILGTFILALGLSSFWPAMNTYLLSSFPMKNMGGDYGATRTIFIIAESAGPLYIGIMGDYSTFNLGFSTLLISLVITLMIILFLIKSYGKV
jgi:MFS family permease